MPPAPEGESPGDPAVAECQRLLEAVPAAAATSPAFRRHWPSISASLAALSSSLASPAFPPSAPLLAPLAAALRALLSVSADAHAPRLGHLHTVSLLSSTAAELSQLAADARLLASAPAAPAPSSSSAAASDPSSALVSRLRMGSAASRAAALEELASTAPALPAPSASAAVSAVAALLDSASAAGCGVADLRERAVAALAALASSDAARPALAQEAGAAVVPHLCRALESGSGATTEHACAALLPLTASSRDASAAVAARGGVSALLSACAGATPAAQAAAAGVLRNLAAFPDLLPAFRDEGGAVPLLLLQPVSLGTPRAQEQALGCLQRLTAGDGDDAQRMKVEVFQAGALPCVRDFLDGSRGAGNGDGDNEPPGLAPALGLLRNMASFRYIAEIAAAASTGGGGGGGSGFVAHVVAALGSDRSATRTEAALALSELCGNAGGGSSKAARQYYEAVVADVAVPRLVWMLEAKAASERDAAARALAAVLGASSACRKAFRKDERGVVNAVQLLGDPSGSGSRGGGGVEEEERRFPVSVLLAVAQSRRCRKQMVAAGACGFLQGLVTAEVEGAKRLAECLGKGKMLGVFPRT